MNNKDEILVKVKEILKDELTTVAYKTWIKDLEIESINDNKIVLVALSKMQKDALESRLYDLVSNTFNYVTNKTCKIEIIVKY